MGRMPSPPRNRRGAHPCAFGTISTTTIKGKLYYRLRSPSPERKALGNYATLDEALRASEAMAAEVEKAGRPLEMTVGDYAERWLDEIEKDPTRRNPHHRQVYDSRVKGSALEVMPIRRVKLADVQAWMDALSRTRATRGRRKGELLSDQTRRNALYVVSQLLKDAARDGRCRLIDVELVKVKRVARTDETWLYLDLEAVERLDAAAKAAGPQTGAFVALALYAGLRRGEIIGLRIGDVKLARKGSSWVEVSRGADGGPTKGGKVRRTPLLPPGAEAVRAWLAVRGNLDPSAPLFALVGADGIERPRDPHWDCGWRDRSKATKTGRSVYPGVRSLAGLPSETRLHDLRHTFASALVEGRYGVAWRLEEVQVFLGHASITTTERYAHLGPDGLAAKADELANGLLRATSTEEASGKVLC